MRIIFLKVLEYFEFTEKLWSFSVFCATSFRRRTDVDLLTVVDCRFFDVVPTLIYWLSLTVVFSTSYRRWFIDCRWLSFFDVVPTLIYRLCFWTLRKNLKFLKNTIAEKFIRNSKLSELSKLFQLNVQRSCDVALTSIATIFTQSKYVIYACAN